MFDPTIYSAIIGLIGVVLGAFLTYQFGSYQESKQRILSERFALYKPVAHCLDDMLNLDEENSDFETKLKGLQIRINRLGRELVLYAPDNVYREFLKTAEFRKGDTGKQISKFFVLLRKELIGKTDVTAKDIYYIKLSSSTS
jgi:hypothetical protein